MRNINKILIAIPSQKIPRQYLLLLKDYFTRTIQGVTIDYFISQHDDSNENLRKAAVLESNTINKDMDLFISFIGNLPKGMFETINAKKVLIHTAEDGNPSNKMAYIKGYDYLLTGNSLWDEQFKDVCEKAGVTLLSGYQNIFEQEFHDIDKKKSTRKKFEDLYPQLIGKRVLSIITHGKCHSKYLKRSKNIQIRDILDKLPDDMILFTNCDNIKVMAQCVSSEYTDKYVAVTQRRILDVLRISDYCVSNHSLASYINGKKCLLLFEDSKYERWASYHMKEQCIEFGSGMEEMISTFLEET